MATTSRPAYILLIEDSQIDEVIFSLMIKRTLNTPVIETCRNGMAAINRLLELKGMGTNHLPDYIFLDLSMPVMNGWEFMEEYARLNIDPVHKSKIYVLSSSIFKDDVLRSHLNPRIENFISKPMDIGTIKNIFLN
jgi:CheY-like chemotaxis protein